MEIKRFEQEFVLNDQKNHFGLLAMGLLGLKDTNIFHQLTGLDIGAIAVAYNASQLREGKPGIEFVLSAKNKPKPDILARFKVRIASKNPTASLKQRKYEKKFWKNDSDGDSYLLTIEFFVKTESSRRHVQVHYGRTPNRRKYYPKLWQVEVFEDEEGLADNGNSTTTITQPDHVYFGVTPRGKIVTPRLSMRGDNLTLINKMEIPVTGENTKGQFNIHTYKNLKYKRYFKSQWKASLPFMKLNKDEFNSMVALIKSEMSA